jgi:fibronectin type 3 domain-containing protein
MSSIRGWTRWAVVLCLVLAAAAPAGAGRNTLAILNLRPINFEAMGYNGEILYALISALEKAKSIDLMPRREMEEILYQATLVQGDTPESALEAGKVLGINFVLFGNVKKTGSQIHATFGLMDVERKQVRRKWRKTFVSREDILEKIPEFAEDLAGTLDSKGRAASAAAADRPSAAHDVRIEGFRAASKGRKVVLQWRLDATRPVRGYRIYRARRSEGPFQFVGDADTPRYEDTKTRKGRSYYYRIGVVLASGEEIKIAQAAEIKSAGEPQPYPPLILSADGFVRRTAIKVVPSLLNEQQGFTIRQYRVYRKNASAGELTPVIVVDARSTSQFELGLTVEDTSGLEDGQTYIYAISSIDAKGRESPASDPVTVRTTERPQIRVAKDGLLRRIEMVWEPVDRVKGYWLYRRQGAGAWERVRRIVAEPAFPVVDDTDLTDGNTYEYHLTAFDDQGESGPSNTVAAVTKPAPSFPGDMAAQSGRVKSVQLDWSPLKDPDVGGYSIYRGTASGQLKRIAKLKGHRTGSYEDRGSGFSSLADGTEYVYRIASYNLFGAEGELSPVVTARTKPRPRQPAGIQVRTSADRIRLSWSANPESDLKAYTVYRRRNRGVWVKVAEIGPSATVFEDADLRPETDYRYRIVAEDSDGLKSDPAESAAIASPVAPPPE